MPIALNTNFTITGTNFEVGNKSMDGTVVVDVNLTGVTSHMGVVFNRQGNRTGPGGIGGTVTSTFGDKIWYEGAGPIINSSGIVQMEQWFRRTSGESEFMAVDVGTVGANKLVRITHSTTGTTRSFTVHAITSLGGTIGAQLVGPVSYSSGSNSEMRSQFFSPFVLDGSAIFRCNRID